MSDESLGTYTFLPWFRRGAATAISTVDPLAAAAPSRAELPVALTMNGSTVAVPTRLYGPGDVIGLDAREIVRTEPIASSVDFPPNYLAAVDFAREDLPWLFTPLKGDAQGRLRPWIALIAVRRQPGVKLTTFAGSPLPVLEIDAPAVPRAELPDLAESWAWAHAQVTGVPAAGQTIDAYLDAAPHLGLSRLICPQRLLPNEHYYACIVPAFRAGLQAGLGLAEEVADLAAAWDLTAIPPSVRIPVYYHWEFATSERGDFESLARALRARKVGPPVGQRLMDVGRPGPGLPTIADGAPGRTLALEGALRPPEAGTAVWPAEASVPFEAAARTLLDAAAVEDPVIGPVLAPPLYGRWHALQVRVPDADPRWFRELNLDPRHRVLAGAGTSAVQRDQEELMEEAWRQVGDVVRANHELKRAQLARAVASSLHAKHLGPLPAEHLVHLTRPVHARVTLSPTTLHREIANSALPPAAVSGALRRLTRPRSSLRRRNLEAGKSRWSAVARLNANEIRAAEPRGQPDAVAALDAIAAKLPLSAPPGSRTRLVASALVVAALVMVLLSLAGTALLAALAALGALGIGAGAMLAARMLRARRLRTARLTPDALQAAPPQPGFRLVVAGESPPARVAEPGSSLDSVEAQRFRTAGARSLGLFQWMLRREPRTPPQPLVLESIAASVRSSLNPETTVVARVRSRIAVPPDLWSPEDPLDPVMAYPEFRRPMYEALAEQSPEFVLPGLEHVPPDTVTLVETNPPVIQAFMTGLNHEMGRELLWREYPTDQRGSYFRQFFDPRGRLPPARTDAEHRARYDVRELHAWQPNEALGEGITTANQQQLVLLLRGELLRRFPTAMVFAERARFNTVANRMEPEGTVEWPMFRGHLQPDVFFFGFALTEEQARGNAQDAGWYLVIQQQPTEPRFGLDDAKEFADTLPPVTNWDDLSWGHLARKDEFDALRFVSVRGTLPETSLVNVPPGVAWGGNAAQMAFITLQKPTRIAIHARLMLPALEQSDA